MGSCFLLLLFTPLESNQLTHILIPGWGGGGGGALPCERSGMLVVSSGCKFRPLVSLRVFQAKRHYILPQRSFSGLQAKKYKKNYIFNSFYLLDLCNQSFFRGHKRLGHPQLISFRGLIQNFRRASPPFSYGSLPHPGASDHYVRSMYYVTRSLI